MCLGISRPPAPTGEEAPIRVASAALELRCEPGCAAGCSARGGDAAPIYAARRRRRDASPGDVRMLNCVRRPGSGSPGETVPIAVASSWVFSE